MECAVPPLFGVADLVVDPFVGVPAACDWTCGLATFQISYGPNRYWPDHLPTGRQCAIDTIVAGDAVLAGTVALGGTLGRLPNSQWSSGVELLLAWSALLLTWSELLMVLALLLTWSGRRPSSHCEPPRKNDDESEEEEEAAGPQSPCHWEIAAL